jgi:HK97 family phage portal protein
MADRLVTARRVVDMPDWYGGGYDLVTGRRTAQPQMRKSPTAYACMSIRGQELANVPWHIVRNDEVLESHPLIDMLLDFGPESNWQKGMLYTELDMLNYGAALWLRDVDVLKKLHPDTMKVNKTREGISGFTQTINGIKTTFSRDEIIYFREYHPEDDLDFGIPVVEVCKKSINAEIEALLMIEAYFKNDATPGIVLSTDAIVPQTEASRIVRWWNARFRGSRKKGNVGVADRGLKPVVVGNSMKDSAVIDILEYTVGDICKAFRLDKVLVGSAKDATFLNLPETRRIMIEDVIMPRAQEYENVINQDLVQKTYPDVKFQFAWDELPILQEDATLKEARLASMFDKGIISAQYYREEMGIEESDKGDEVDKGKVAEDKWQKKAVKAILRGDKADVSFDTDNIDIDRQYLLHARLTNCNTEEEVKRAFA